MAVIKCEYFESYCSFLEIGTEREKAKVCDDHYHDCEGCQYNDYLTKKFENNYKRYELCIDSQKDWDGFHRGYLKIAKKEISLPDMNYLEIDGKVYVKDGVTI